MRPVLLEIAGFGSFRAPATVDFTDAEYFALVGPTGSGKSTVIDAMTFALFGSVPRWADRRTVSLALAPTVNRGTVRLVFEAAGSRYVVARELRRGGNGNVTVRGARLEKLTVPGGLGISGEPTDVLAADSEVSRAVEKLLGLTFEHFCTCVVLPQGDFAEFLHAKPAERQKILTRLLGLGVYDEIRTAANDTAKLRQHDAETIDKQLAAFADATDEAVQSATDRVKDLEQTVGEVDEALAAIATRAAAERDARHALERVLGERDLLAAARMPDGVAAVVAGLAAATTAAIAAGERRRDAERLDTAARDALAAAPERGPLEQARRDHGDLERLVLARPEAAARRAAAQATLERLASAVTDTRAARAARETARDQAARAAEAAEAEVARLRTERDQLAAVRAPAGVVELAGRLRDARAAVVTAAARRAAAEQADEAARAALTAVPSRAVLERTRDAHDDLARLVPSHAAAQAAHAAASAALEKATAAADAARVRREQAAGALDRARTSDLAAAMRPHLVVGEPCPVCEQTVHTVPAGDGHAALAQAQAALRAAETELGAAEERRTDAGRAEYEARRDAARLGEQIEQLRRQVEGEPGATAVAARLTELDGLEREATRCARELSAARHDAERAERAAASLISAGTRARSELSQVRDPLVVLGAPGFVEGSDGADGFGIDLAASWERLVGWAGNLAAERSAALAAASERDTAAREALAAADQALAQASAAATRAEHDHTDAVVDESGAARDLQAVDEKIASLRASLAGTPGPKEVAAALADLDRLAAQARDADQRLRAARAEADTADAAARDAREALRAAQAVLARTRDTVVALGAPALGGGDLLADWQALTDWARAEASARTGQLPALEAAVTTASAALASASGALVETLTAHGVAPPPDASTATVVDGAARAVATVLERARAELDRLTERRAQAVHLREDLAQAREGEQVAHQLGMLLRSDRFQRWLVAEALDVLVADASDTLRDLSNGQFELTHEDGDFVVVDHADADSRRPVRTLSGGETFQASLALALALSSHLTSMAAAGAARLDSIFLDEGFGTLDDATLDVVAATLENLAGAGGRMVGIVTHVRALAERVPVRFAVSRDQASSTVAREES